MMIAGSLLVTSWVLVLNAVFLAGGDTFLKQAISLAYPIGDVVVVTIVVYVMLRIRQTGMPADVPARADRRRAVRARVRGQRLRLPHGDERTTCRAASSTSAGSSATR